MASGGTQNAKIMEFPLEIGLKALTQAFWRLLGYSSWSMGPLLLSNPLFQKKTAFDIVVKLYHDNKIEPNTGRRNWGDGPSGNVLGGAMQPTHPPYLNPNCTPRERDEFFVKSKLGSI